MISTGSNAEGRQGGDRDRDWNSQLKETERGAPGDIDIAVSEGE